MDIVLLLNKFESIIDVLSFTFILLLKTAHEFIAPW